MSPNYTYIYIYIYILETQHHGVTLQKQGKTKGKK
jgi:hypothetical protein